MKPPPVRCRRRDRDSLSLSRSSHRIGVTVVVAVAVLAALTATTATKSKSSTQTLPSLHPSSRRKRHIHNSAPLVPISEDPAAEDSISISPVAAVVRWELSRRLAYVTSGKRQRDLAQWMTLTPRQQLQQQVSKQRRRASDKKYNDDDPFPCNRESLDLVGTWNVSTQSYSYIYDSYDASPVYDTENASSTALSSTVFQHSHSSSILTPSSTVSAALSSAWTNSRRLVQLWARAMRLGWNFGPVWSTVGMALVSDSFRNHVWYGWLAHALGQSGPAWIKWAQWSSTRPDLFPDALCDALALLHANAPSHAWTHSQQALAESLRLNVPPKEDPAAAAVSSSSSQLLLRQVFDEIDETPIASGSIAQVHKAILHNGQVVAMKIRHPRVQELMELDFTLMKWTAACVDCIPSLQWLHVRETVTQFSTTLSAQANLRAEAMHLERLNHNFRSWPHVRFPQPIFASDNVIIETFEPGRIVTTFLDMYNALAMTIQQDPVAVQDDDDVNKQKSELVLDPLSKSIQRVHAGGDSDTATSETTAGDPIVTKRIDEQKQMDGVRRGPVQGHHLIPIGISKFIVTTGLELYLKMLLVDNLMHADLHPGNIMIQFQPHKHSLKPVVIDAAAVHHHHKDQDPNVNNLQGICLVDAGMVTELSDSESTYFIGLLSSLGEGDGASAAEYVLGFSSAHRRDGVLNAEKKAAFTADMIQLFAERCRGYGTHVDVGHVLRGVLTLVRIHHVRIDAHFATLVVNCLCIESLAREVCPAYNVLDAARPLLQNFFYHPPPGRQQRPLSVDPTETCLHKKKQKSNAPWMVLLCWKEFGLRLRQKWQQHCVLPLRYVQKKWHDDWFFRREARTRERARAQQLLQWRRQEQKRKQQKKKKKSIEIIE